MIPRYSQVPKPMETHEAPDHTHLERSRDVIVIGGGMAGLSAAIYLGRAMRDVLVVDSGESLAIWEPEVQNYLGFPECISGGELLRRGREQAEHYGAEFAREEIERIELREGRFHLRGKKSNFTSRRLLLATGVYHLPPKIPSVDECVGKSIFFCKDCDGYRVQGKRVIIAGNNDEAVEYALGILLYTDCVTLLTNGDVPRWSEQHERWMREHDLPMQIERIMRLDHREGQMRGVTLESGQRIPADCLFTTRGDVFHNELARQLGASIDSDGQVLVDDCQRSSVPGLYAAGCVTPANCQMIIAAGAGAAAAQAINRDMFEEALERGELRRLRREQVRHAERDLGIGRQN